MATDDTIIGRINKFEIANAEKYGQMSGDIRVLTSEVQRLTDSVKANVASQATKEEVAAFRAQGQIEHHSLEQRVTKLEGWNSWATRIVVGAVIVAVLSAIVITKGAH